MNTERRLLQGVVAIAWTVPLTATVAPVAHEGMRTRIVQEPATEPVTVSARI